MEGDEVKPINEITNRRNPTFLIGELIPLKMFNVVETSWIGDTRVEH